MWYNTPRSYKKRRRIIWTDIDLKLEQPQNKPDLYYYSLFDMLFRIENAMRVFVYIVLKAKHGKSWHDQNIMTDNADGKAPSIKGLAKSRYRYGEIYGNIGYWDRCPLLYLTFGELCNIIESKSCWPDFAPHLGVQKEMALQKLREIECVRNAFAHFRPVLQEDLDVVKHNTDNVMFGVEELLCAATGRGDRLPSTIKEKWLRELCCMGEKGEYEVRRSSCGGWIKLDMKVRLPLLKITIPEEFDYDDGFDFEMANIHPVRILTHFASIADNVIYVSEVEMSQEFHTGSEHPIGYKTLRFVFEAKRLEMHWKEIVNEFKALSESIGNETELLTQDPESEGLLMHRVKSRCIPWEEPEVFDISVEGNKMWYGERVMDILRQPDDPVEYWGDTSFPSNNIITSAICYPWSTPVYFYDHRAKFRKYILDGKFKKDRPPE